MIVLYDKFKTSDFDSNDLVLKNTTKCEVTWEKNGQFQIDLVYPILSDDDRWQSIVKGAIVKCPVAYQNDQLFRLNTPTKKMDSGYYYIEVTGYHITYDLNYNLVENVTISNKSGIDAGQEILNNTQYSHPFSWNSDIATIASSTYIRQNPTDALIGTGDNTFLQIWGGELVRDNFNIGMFNQAGKNRGVTIKYSKNLTGFEQSADDSNMITRAMPYINDDSTSTDDSTTQSTDTVITLPEKYVDSPKINDYANIYIKPIEVTLTDDQKILNADQKYQVMRDYVNNLYANNNDVPTYSYSVNFIELSNTEEYKDYAILEEVHPYDFVVIKALDIDVIAELVGYTYDALVKNYIGITLGNIKNDILRSNQKSLFQISKQNQNNIKILQAQIGDIPNSMLSIATSTTSGGNNLFDHSIPEDKYVSEWVTTGGTVVDDATLHDTDKVWKLPPNASLSKADVLVNPNNYKSKQLMFSLQAKYSGLTITDSGQYNVPNQTNVLLGALDAVIKRCIVDTKGTTWTFNGNNTGVITERIGVTGGTGITITNSNNYPYVIHAYDNLGNQLADFTTSPIPNNVFQIAVEILQSMSPQAIAGFNIFETNPYTADSISFLYANKTNCDWEVQEQSFNLTTEHPSDIIQQINFRASNNDANGTVYIGAFMINTGTVRNDFSQSSNDTVQTLRAHQIVADYIQANQADIDKLHATNATVDNLSATYATITNLTATNGNIQNLTASVGNIMDLTTNTLKSHIVTADNMVAGTITAGCGVIANGAIGNAQIAELDAGKVKTGQLSTSLVTIESSSGNMYIADNTIQIKDSSRVRVQIGKDASNDYNMYVWDASGNLMFDATGLKAQGIKDKIIRNDMVSDTANIDGSKLDIDSVVTSINGSTTLLKSTQVQLSTANQTLEVAFNNLTNTVTSQGNTVQSQGTSISTMQGQISSKIWNTDITAARNALQSEITTTQTDLTQTNTAIGFNASNQSFTNATGSLSGRLNSAESSIQVQAGQISSKVSTTDYNGNTLVSMINQSSSKINMSALNINLSGYVTFNSLSTAGSTTINGNNITTGTLSASKISGGTLTLGGSSNTNGLLQVYNASSTKVVQLDQTGITITVQNDSTGFNIKNNAGTSLLSINGGSGEATYAGLWTVNNGVAATGETTINNGTVYISSTALTNALTLSIGTGDGASWSSYNSSIQSWQGLAFGTNANYDGTGTAFKPRILMNCRTGDLTLKNALYATGFQRTSDSKWAVFSSNIDNIFYQGTGFNWVSGGTSYWVYQSGGSDERLKANIIPSTKNCLDTINNINIVQYNWIEDGKHIDVGVIAQQMSTLNSEFMRPFMTKGNVDYYAPNWDKVMPYVIGSLQEEDSKIQELELKITNLENEIQQLKAAS
ncbi:phage minor structural protein, N-terminal region [Clostridium acidisoli DSM 12555]|uniref:Phage minor structural protein, N-terminal region n=1 Tax=Clostridium acidisoli DSM 12555 TaxID=1121291 RepID=A0A1W1X6D9_9CLOT|nr:phage tail spike protein [Clostridium acidisoli]SMC19288.1 phage minor structural protein, N-terminal region [Clostridium acidisoli DSM 12555]